MASGWADEPPKASRIRFGEAQHCTPDLRIFARLEHGISSERKGEYLDRESRPPWEPQVTCSPSAISRNPGLEYVAMDLLRQQGCTDTANHYRHTHKCRVLSIRLQCLRQIRQWHQKPTIFKRITDKLPDELTLKIAEFAVSDSQPFLSLETAETLFETADDLVGDIPDTTLKTKLVSIYEQAILSESTIRADVVFKRNGAEKTAILADWARAPNLSHHIRNFDLFLCTEIDIRVFRGIVAVNPTAKYPANLFLATSTMSSLAHQLADSLQTFRITLRLNTRYHPRESATKALDVSCRQGFSGMTTYRHVIMNLLDAAKTAFAHSEVSFGVEYCRSLDFPFSSWNRELSVLYLGLGTRPVGDVLDEADTHARAD